MSTISLDEVAVKNFKEYLRIPTISPDCDYNKCVQFISSIVKEIGLPVHVEWVTEDRPVVVASWRGSDPGLSSLLLSSHMDVVPVYADKWTHEPFSAEEDKDGNIYARGAQDMKCVGIQYLEAVRRLIMRGRQPKRTVHICFTPDEEIGSLKGMEKFVETEYFKKMNVGCALDEGGANPSDEFDVYYGELTRNPFTIVCTGTPGHGSLLHDSTAGEKIAVVINRVMAKRAELKRKLKTLSPGEVTTLNLTMLQGGIQSNVVPPELKVTFDCRVHPGTDINEFEKWILDVCKEAGEGVKLESPLDKDIIKPTVLRKSSNSWWAALKRQFDMMEIKVKPAIFCGCTDSRFLRKLGIPAFGFSPMNHTPNRAHTHDEFLNRDIFLKGIEIYMNIISGLTSV